MIVVTGQGRSGTSIVAALYKQLGFDPGGGFDSDVGGGFETQDVVQENIRIIRDLGMGTSGRRFGLMTYVLPQGVRRVGKRVPLALRRPIRSLYKEPPGRSNRKLELLDWARFEEVTSRHAPALRDLATAHPVVKDPRFCWTLGLWAAAGATIDHVLVCVRSLDAMVESRVAAGWLAPRSRDGAKNWFAYGLGLCLTACSEYRLSHSLIRFPDFLEQPDELFSAMRFPRPVPREDFLRAFEEHVDRDRVHDQR